MSWSFSNLLECKGHGHERFPQTVTFFVRDGQMARLPDIAGPSASAFLILLRDKAEQQPGVIFNKERLQTSRDLIFQTINAVCLKTAIYCPHTYHISYQTPRNH